MQSLDYYLGREQTYLKHFFLERYLERVTPAVIQLPAAVSPRYTELSNLR